MQANISKADERVLLSEAFGGKVWHGFQETQQSALNNKEGMFTVEKQKRSKQAAVQAVKDCIGLMIVKHSSKLNMLGKQFTK